MFNVYDTEEKRYIARLGWETRRNAARVAKARNIQDCGMEEIRKPESERRYIVKER